MSPEKVLVTCFHGQKWVALDDYTKLYEKMAGFRRFNLVPMTMKEAFESDRPVRRRGRATWHLRGGGSCTTANGGWLDPDFFVAEVLFSKEDIAATDWEVRP